MRSALIRILFVFLVILQSCKSSKKVYNGYSLIQAYPDNQEQTDYLNSLENDPGHLEIQVWQPGSVYRPFELLVSPASKKVFTVVLDKKAIRYTVKIDDIERILQEEQMSVEPQNLVLSTSIPNATYFTRYLQLDEINTYLNNLAVSYPKIVQMETFGTSFEGRPINVVKVGTGCCNKSAIWIDGGIHAREWISPATVLFMLAKLVVDRDLQKYVEQLNWYFVPVLNVDGYEYSRTTDRMWRKNRRSDFCRGCCEGVDLNRNFDFKFGGAGTSSNPCSEIFRGPSAFSEPESRAVRDFVLKHRTELKSFITIHSYSQMWMYPYADELRSYPDDAYELHLLSYKAVNAIRSLYGTRYQFGTAANLLYPVTGGSNDWAKAEAYVKYAFALELRPSSTQWANGFVLTPDQIVPTGEETWMGIKAVADHILRR